MTLLRPLSRRITRALSFAVLCAWLATMAVARATARTCRPRPATSRPTSRATARPPSGAASTTAAKRSASPSARPLPTDDGFELQEDGRLQMSLLGATTAATIRTTARVDRDFALRSFEFSLDPGTGADRGARPTSTAAALRIVGHDGAGSADRRARAGRAAGAVANLSRRLADGGLAPGARTTSGRSSIRRRCATRRSRSTSASASWCACGRPRRSGVPRRDGVRRAAHHVVGHRHRRGRARGEPAGADHGARDAAEARRAMAVPGQRAAPTCSRPRRSCRDRGSASTSRATCAGCGCGSTAPICPAPISHGAGQTVDGNVVEIARSAGICRPGRPIRTSRAISRPSRSSKATRRRSAPKPRRRSRGVTGARARAERLTRYVNALLEKKPTVSLPSAREVLRTKVGDCNEHTALYVAMARALGIPARIAVGLVFVRGAFYYHAWPEVYIDEGRGRGLWLPVDPTFNQFPADATHLRLARGGLDKQAAILPLIGRLKMTILDLELAPDSTPILVGRAAEPISAAGDRRSRAHAADCWSPCRASRRDDCHSRSRQALRHVHGGRRRQPRRARRARSTASSARTAPARRRRSG